MAFLFIGGGAKMESLKAKVAESRLTQVIFLPYQPRDSLEDSLAAADVHLASLIPSLEGMIVPSKFYGILAAGRPLIFIGDPDGELARVIGAAQCGLVVAQDSPRISFPPYGSCNTTARCALEWGMPAEDCCPSDIRPNSDWTVGPNCWPDFRRSGTTRRSATELAPGPVILAGLCIWAYSFTPPGYIKSTIDELCLTLRCHLSETHWRYQVTLAR